MQIRDPKEEEKQLALASENVERALREILTDIEHMIKFPIKNSYMNYSRQSYDMA